MSTTFCLKDFLGRTWYSVALGRAHVCHVIVKFDFLRASEKHMVVTTAYVLTRTVAIVVALLVLV